MSDFAKRMKHYENIESKRLFIPLLPILVRMDGRGFSHLTKNLSQPFDENLTAAMDYVTLSLVRETNATIGYTQSDEITLVLYHDKFESQPYFGGKIQKIVSHTAAQATMKFNEYIYLNAPETLGDMIGATFDSRAWQVPNEWEASNAILVREFDATRNSVQMAARHCFSHRKCQNKNNAQLQDMLMEIRINWNDYPARFKRGAYFNKAGQIDMPVFSTVVNRDKVVCCGEEPRTDE